ncbi:putative periplasmic binding protein-like I [Helianthus annuus]|nr:putative periplasmic binding protein-like I [Helianthus annuus]KAJ0644286.1 putative periplasmic binding protein-like I [Helianthus annuus]KAJ0820572.1 putative periplasmic binding protein-like I [Helianthus annuus]
METWIGNSIYSCINLAISDFYSINHNYTTRIVLQTKDSEGDPLKALSAIRYLLKNKNVQAIIGPETYLQSKLLALIADKAKVPIFSFASPSSMEYPYLFQIKEDKSTMAKSLAALVKSYKWRNVIFIYEDTEVGREILPYFLASSQDKNIGIYYKSAISASATHDQINVELSKLKNFSTSIIIVHMSPSLASSVFLIAKRLGMIREGYVWILTEKTVDIFRSTKFEVIESLQGALGFRSYVPASSRLYSLTTRWYTSFFKMYPSYVRSCLCLPYGRMTQFGHLRSLSKRLESHTMFQFSKGKVVTNGYEIVNAIDHGDKRVGYWTESEGIKKAHPLITSGNRYSSMGLEHVIWPGGAATAPKGGVLATIPGKRLKIGVLKITNFKYFMDIDHDVEKNVTTATGFSFDVFNHCISALPYEVPYELIPFENGTYDHLVQKVYNQEIDAVVGDSTILASRSEYVDFTATYSDLGVGTLVRMKKKDMWIFLKPLGIDLWLTAIAFVIFTVFVVWAIEYMNQESENSPPLRLGTIFWLVLLTIFSAQREKKLSSNSSSLVMYTWLIVVLILITSYTATLSSMLTVEQFQLASNEGIFGFNGNSFMRRVTVSNLNFEDHKLRPYYSYQDYAHALWKGGKHGGADAIIDEIPYIKMFLSKYSNGYAMVSSQPITSGFGFIFPKGSRLGTELSREIAKMRLDGILEDMEKKWFRNRIPYSSQDSSIMPKSLNLGRLGGLFIVSGIFSALTLVISAVYLLRAKMEVHNIISLIDKHNLMASIRYLFYRNVIIHN